MSSIFSQEIRHVRDYAEDIGGCVWAQEKHVNFAKRKHNFEKFASKNVLLTAKRLRIANRSENSL